MPARDRQLGRQCDLRVALFVLVACTASPEEPPPEGAPVPGPRVVADRSTYSRRRQDTVQVWLTNPTGVPVFRFPNGSVLQRYYDGAWRPFLTDYGFIATPAVRLSATDTDRVILPLEPQQFPVDGWYRVAYPLYDDSILRTSPWPQANTTARFQVTQ